MFINQIMLNKNNLKFYARSYIVDHSNLFNFYVKIIIFKERILLGNKQIIKDIDF